MELVPTAFNGLWEIHTAPRGDERGRFTRIFCEESFSVIRAGLRFVQVNSSITTRRGTIRGLHFQRAPASDAKLIRCVRGAVYDVAVDLRTESSTFGHWHAIELTDTNERQIFIPEGFAHGFQALTNEVELLYQHTYPHTASAEGGVRYDDPALAVFWPLPVTVISERDASLPTLNPADRSIAA